MEITIRTYDQFRDDRVKVEVSPDQRVEITFDGEVSTEEIRLPSRNIHTDDDVAAARVIEAAPLRRRIAELEADLKAAEIRAAGWNRDRHTEQRRADENREWAKRAEASLTKALVNLSESSDLVRQKEAIIDQYVKDLMESRKFRAKEREEARQKIEALTHQLDRVRVAVRGLTLDQVVVSYVDHDEYQVRHMVRRLRRIRALLDVGEPEAEQDTKA